MSNILTILLVLMLNISLFALDVNQTILTADKTVYQNLLQKLSTDINITQEKSLQRTLLQELIDIKSDDYNFPKPIEVKDTKSFQKLFLQYLSTIEKVKELKSDITNW